MKHLIIILIILTTTIFAESKPIMLKILTKVKLNETTTKTFRAGVEMSLTQNNYSLIDEVVQEEALKEQRTEIEDDCIDDSCLMDTGKMLAARFLFIVDITEITSGKKYLFKVRLIDLETNEIKKSSSKLYSDSLFNADSLFKFSQELTNLGLGVEKTKQKLVNISDLIKITVNSQPSGANVHIDGKFIGKTPAQAKIAKGKHKFKVFTDKYQDYIIENELYIDKNIKVKLKPKVYEVEIKSSPTNADLYYKGKLMGKTPIKLKVFAIEKGKITLKKEGFRKGSVAVPAQKNPSVLVTLVELPFHTLTITTNPSYAKITLINNYNTKFTLKSGEPKKLHQGKYKISIKEKNHSAPKGTGVSHTPLNTLNLNKNTSLNIKMTPNYNRFFKTFGAFDITIGNGYQYMSAGIGTEIINSVTNIRKFTIGGLFYQNLTDRYAHSDIYMDYKFELFNNFSLGVSASYLLLLASDKRENILSGFFAGANIEYSYDIIKDIFISAKVKAGASYFLVDNASVQYYIVSGIHLGWNGF